MVQDSHLHDISPSINLQQCAAEIKAALAERGTPQQAVEIVAVSKKQPAALIQKALDAGHRCFGENRVQEAQTKWPSLKSRAPDAVLHLIGPLQSNKAAAAVALFDVIETVDRPKIARILAEEIRRQARNPALLVQVNTGEEPQKAGIIPSDVEGFVHECRTQYGLTIEGLMCIPPVSEPPAPHFALLKKMADRLNLNKVSMGMSADYQIAAQLGATHVRVGTGIFGPRQA